MVIKVFLIHSCFLGRNVNLNFETTSHKNSETNSSSPNFNVCKDVTDDSCHSGSLYPRHNTELEEEGIRIGICCTPSNVLKILTAFNEDLNIF